MDAAPMPSEARIFLKALFAGKPDELYLLLWTLPEKQSHWFRDIEGAMKFAESLRERDLYVGAGFASKDHGATRRCPSHEIAGIVGLWADLDLRSEAHSKVALPASVEDALKILPEQLPPTFVIRTGNGAHAWWLFREPLLFESDEERLNAGGLAHRWQSLLRANAAARTRSGLCDQAVLCGRDACPEDALHLSTGILNGGGNLRQASEPVGLE